jgi:adenine-specific DNA-methyltransferase
MSSYDVFTPPEVSAKMRSYLPDRVNRLLEPSVGEGDLFRCMEGTYDHADVADINPAYLEKVPDAPNVRKMCGNFLEMTLPEKYDAILMNPPYLRYQSMAAEMRTQVRELSPVLRSGNVDLYMAFLVKCLGLLTEQGRMVAIVPSAWRYTKSAKSFREWILGGRHVVSIHDYGSAKVFKGINVYCCILVLTQTPNASYTINDEVMPYDVPTNAATPIQTLGEVATLHNGVATLCDAIFIHDTPLFEEPCWRPILKVSKQSVRSILYPYADDGTILPEAGFKLSNPQTYAYLTRNRERLAARDRGAKTYEAWYAFGRRQGLKIPTTSATSVYISSLCAPTLPMVEHATMLFYSGLRITPHATTCKNIQESIVAARPTIVASSAKRSSNWITLTTTCLRQVQVHPQTPQSE